MSAAIDNCAICEQTSESVKLTLQDRETNVNNELVKLASGQLVHRYHLHCGACRPEHDIDPEDVVHIAGDNGNIICEFQWILSHQDLEYCFGCKCPILDRIYRDELGASVWHPECQLIYKSWNFCLASSSDAFLSSIIHEKDEFMTRILAVRIKRDSIWRVLSAFEEGVAQSISDLLDNVSLKSFTKTVDESNNLICHFVGLYKGLDLVQCAFFDGSSEAMSTREPKLLAKKVVNFLSLLLDMYILPPSDPTQKVKDNSEITSELVGVVTDIARYLKIVVRSALIAGLKLEQESGQTSVSGDFLSCLSSALDHESAKDLLIENAVNDLCTACRRPIEQPCIAYDKYLWHLPCFNCSESGTDLSHRINEARISEKDVKLYSAKLAPPHAKSGFLKVSQITQYGHLLHVALKRFKLAIDSHVLKHVDVPGEQRADLSQRQRITGPATSSSKNNQSLEVNMSIANDPVELVPSRWPHYSSSPTESPSSTSESVVCNTEILFLSRLEPLQTVAASRLAIVHLSKSLHKKYTVNDLAAMIRIPKPSLLAKLFPSRKTARSSQTDESTDKIFGKDLALLVNNDGEYLSDGVRIPLFTSKVIQLLEGKDLTVEGIFRKNGNIRKLNELQAAVDTINGDLKCLDDENPIQLAAILKKYIRDLPEPLLTFKLYPLFISIASQTELQVRKECLHYACCLLPKPNRDLLFSIARFMKKVAGFADKNKMDMRNLAIVIAPNILYSQESSQRLAKSESDAVNEVVELIFEHVGELAVLPEQIAKVISRLDVRTLGNMPEKQLMKSFESLMKDEQNEKSPLSKRSLSLSAESLPPLNKKNK